MAGHGGKSSSGPPLPLLPELIIGVNFLLHELNGFRRLFAYRRTSARVHASRWAISAVRNPLSVISRTARVWRYLVAWRVVRPARWMR